MVMNAISISCASDEAYYCGLLVTLHSLVSHAKEGSHLVCHVLDTGLSEKSKTDLVNRLSLIPERSVKVVFHPIDASQFENLPEWRGSHTAYGRLLLHDILKDEDYTIYTDIDTLWLRDVSELWAMRAEVPVLAAVPDGSGLIELSSGKDRSCEFSKLGKNVHPEHYYCSGLLLMNLKELRARNFSSAWRGFIDKYSSIMKFPDQDIYNWFFQPPDVKLLDFKWGEFPTVYGERGLQEPRVIHYAKQAPWNHKITAVGMLWWRYVRQNLKRSRFSYAANWRCFLFSLLRIPFVFNIIYGMLFLVNKKAYAKRRKAIYADCLKELSIIVASVRS